MKLDPKKTALLTLDCRMGILDLFPTVLAHGYHAIIPNAAKALKGSVLGFQGDIFDSA